MTEPEGSEKRAEPETTDTAPLVMRRTGQTERYVLQAAALRRRQLRAAVLYGSARSWRQRQSLWPAALIGAIVVALIVAAIAVANAFERQRQSELEQEQQYSSLVQFRH